jgi:glutamate racemase
MSDADAPIGVFDSGVGGLSVLREIAALLPSTPLVYVADTAHVPYGGRPPEFIRERSLAISRFLLQQQGARAVVVACNTATTHAVDHLRAVFGHVPIIGMEPALKPAAAATRSGVVGVLATEATLGGERFVSLVQRYTDGVELLTQPAPGLVEQVEAGDLSGPRTVELLRTYIAPMIDRGADTIVLGCTHYPFLRPALQDLVGPGVTLIDTGAAVARQVQRLCLPEPTVPVPPGGGVRAPAPRFYTSGDPDAMRRILVRLWGDPPHDVARLPA